jgi:type 1 fimbria pilin
VWSPGAFLLTAVVALSGPILAPDAGAATQTLTLQDTVTAATCTVSAPGTLPLPTVNVSLVTGAKPDPAAGKTFDVKVDCTGATAPGKGVIDIWGDKVDATSGDTTLFANQDSSASAAKGVGFVLTNDGDGSGTLLQASTTQGGANGTTVQVYAKNAPLKATQNVPFYVMPYRGGNVKDDVRAGTLSTTLHFDFEWQ